MSSPAPADPSDTDDASDNTPPDPLVEEDHESETDSDIEPEPATDPQPSDEASELEPGLEEGAAVSTVSSHAAQVADEAPRARTAAGGQAEAETVDEVGPTQKATDVITAGLLRVREFLQEVSGACQIGAASAPGAPALTFAVLGVAAMLGRDWSLRAGWPGDEDVPELLYANDVIAPG